ncbi:glycosyltransferase [Dermatophilus congolensis]|uniref:glycosyltransferase n=1 Tax=Dermatophilus congolensis TaxID=1863 RepID=UPI001AAE4CA6|nr:glycosyltransferase [Dermatophilus congolensis]MBO3143423.1 glycosyltransferase [Dermatophilus congolensis]MBO3152413.1 glycosyltransferase [Dermatophilus congolensis]MBO3160576.1 glycosyltransferase [Dermatophilus congolensis]MBO3163700.1 glycosyltransferase [Dermatophilus congolensis]MBO3177246.1 glycosyltransferase [Dermatophilus congolensis]
MSTVPAVVHLDPKNITEGIRQAASLITSIASDESVVIVFDGVDNPTKEQTDFVESELTSLLGDEVVHRLRLIGEKKLPSRTGESLLLTSAENVVNNGEDRVTRGVAASGYIDDEVSAWIKNRDSLIETRDQVTPTRPALVVGIVHTDAGLFTLEPVLLAIKSEGGLVAWIDASGKNLMSNNKNLSEIEVKTYSWLLERYENPSEGPLITLFSDYPAGGGYSEFSASRAAEYGVRVGYVCAPGELGQDTPEDIAFDTDAFRAAWRIYCASERQERLIEKYCRTGSSAVCKSGTPIVDRLLYKDKKKNKEKSIENRENLPIFLWHPDLRRMLSPQDPRVYLKEMINLLSERRDFKVVTHPKSWLPKDPFVSRAWRQVLSDLEDLPNLVVDWSRDPYDALSCVDAGIVGANGPVSELLMRDVPVLYMHRPQVSLDTGAEINLSCVVATEWKEVRNFIQEVIEGKNPGRSSRELGRMRYCDHEGSNAVNRIKDDIVYTLWLQRQNYWKERPEEIWPNITPLLSVAMIVKDEEGNITPCLESLNSIKDVVSEIVVYDTGSSDKTVELAAAFGAVVERGYWDQDFSRARNDAVRLCRGRWVLMIDADDRASGDALKIMRTLAFGLTLKSIQPAVLCLTVTDVRRGGAVLQSYPVPRLLRPDLASWQRRIHEEPQRLDGKPSAFVRVSPSDITFRTSGYEDADVVRRKTLRNLEVAELEVKSAELSGDTDSLIRGLVDRARSGLAHGRIKEALEDFERVRYLPSNFLYRVWGMEQYSSLLLDLGLNEEAMNVIDQLKYEGASVTQISWLEVRLLVNQGKNREALEEVRKLKKVVNSMAMEQSYGEILEVRLRLTVAEGQFDEALAVLILLISRYGRVEGRVPLLMRLWGKRPTEELARHLLAADDGYLDSLLSELDADEGAGPEVAAELRRLRVAV